MTFQTIKASAPESQSADVVAENIAQLKALFPELVTKGKDDPEINVDVLKQLVGDMTVTDADERYGLNWHGKRRARQLALTPSTGTLCPSPDESVDWDTTQNLMIEGDNLEVLKLLQKSYAGKVNLIYIDPSYNTGTRIIETDAEPLALGIAQWHKALAIAGDGTCVFRDNAFANDVTKTNVAAILDKHGFAQVRSL